MKKEKRKRKSAVVRWLFSNKAKKENFRNSGVAWHSTARPVLPSRRGEKRQIKNREDRG